MAGPRSQVEQTISFGYDAIVGRYLRDVDAASVALEGIKGLSAVDEQFAARLEGNDVVLLHDDLAFARLAAPAANDTRGWADLTVKAFASAGAVSDKIAAMDEESLYETVFDATLAKLDRFSRYHSAAEARENRASRNGFGGIGIRYRADELGLQISTIMEESPAAEAELQVGDTLTHIDGVSVTGMDAAEISRRLRGAIASQVVVTIRRAGTRKPLQVSLRRSLVVPPTVTTELVDGVALIRISGFNQRTASSVTREVEKALRLSGGHLDGVILDLRGNPGGLLDQGVAVADLFIPEGRIVFTQGRHPHANQSYTASRGDLGESLPLVVLVDGRSASAAEILAAALQDAGRAVLVGTNSYGKGTVQTVIRMPNSGEMTLTWSRFHSPTGYALHGLGVLPTVCTSGSDDTADRLLHSVRVGEVPIATAIPMWRTVGFEEKERREELRSSCPKERHKDADLDVEVAADLLRDPELYRQALSYTTRYEPLRSASVHYIGN